MPKGTDYAGSRKGPKKRIMRALKINEISGVDTPAQEGAKAVLMKRNESETVEKSVGITTETDGHTHLVVLRTAGADLTGGQTEFDDTGHTHPWVLTDDGRVVFGAAHGLMDAPHSHELAELSKNENTGLDTQVSDAEGKPANLLKNDAGTNNPEAAGGSAGTVGTEGDYDIMTDKIEKATDDAAVEELQAKLDRAEGIADMNDAEKAHFATLGATDQDVFLAKSAGQRKSEVEAIAKAAADSDPVEYVTMDGVELRKSSGVALISLAKSNDTLRKQNDELMKKATDEAYAKRAEAELAHIPGDVAVRAALLKSVDAIEDDGHREAALAALRAQNETMAPAFKNAGHAGATAVDTSAEKDLETMAKKHAADNKVSYVKAYSAVLSTPEGADLYAKSVS